MPKKRRVSSKQRALKETYRSLDQKVDKWKSISTLVERGEALEQDLDLATKEVLLSLEPYHAKYVLLFSGRLDRKAWTPDTFSFMHLMSGSYSRNPSDYDRALSRVRFLAREFSIPDSSSFTENWCSFGHNDIEATELYKVFIEITLEILSKYQVRYKKENNERINFLYVYQTSFRYKLRQWLSSLGRDYYVWNNKKEINECDEGWLEDRIEYEESLKSNDGGFFNSFEEFLASDKKPWSALTLKEKTALWHKHILGESLKSTAAAIGCSVSECKKVLDRSRGFVQAILGSNFDE